ncbi:hypothetical protein ACOSP7_019546 [Xanthoceras sorbifolium]
MGCSHLNVLNMSSSSSSSSPSTTATAIRPRLIPSPNTSLPQTTTLLALSLCNHQANGTEQSRTDFMGTSRWNPTPEQLLSLEEMYRRGLRTPSAEQIQRIAAQLRRFGKIEGKNVFYWFQNHKARERQKRRREMETTLMMMNPEEEKQHIDHGNSSSEYKKESAGLKKTGYDVEQGKNWVPSSNCSKHTEESTSMHRGGVAAESAIGPHGWSPFDEKKLLHQRKSSLMISTIDQMNSTWQIPSSSKLMDMTITTTSLEAKSPLKPYPLEKNFNNVVADYDDENRSSETQRTLELFPLCRDEDGNNNAKATTNKNNDTETLHIKPINAAHFTTPAHFIEFLPLKN